MAASRVSLVIVWLCVCRFALGQSTPPTGPAVIRPVLVDQQIPLEAEVPSLTPACPGEEEVRIPLVECFDCYAESSYVPPESLPEEYAKPRPWTLFQGFQDPEPINIFPKLHWPCGGHQMTPALTVYGSYNLFGVGFEENRRTTTGVGHQMLIDVDFSLGATERVHAQWRPVGAKNSGGSLLRLNRDVHYIDNFDPLPQRLWLEASLAEVLSGIVPDTVPLDVVITAGLFPYELHNRLLINDDIVGVVLSKNSMQFGPISNLLVQCFGAFDEIDAFPNEEDVRLYGVHSQIDWHGRFLEASYAHLLDSTIASRNQDYFAVSATQFLGPCTLAGRFLANLGDDGQDGGGQLYVLEANRLREFSNCLWIFESAVLYMTAFWATEGWNPISGGNFDRLRSTFAVNPLVRLGVDPGGVERRGIALGTELFTHHQDVALIPEFAADFVDSAEVYGFGCRLRRKLGRQSQLELRALTSITATDSRRRRGVFLEWIKFF